MLTIDNFNVEPNYQWFVRLEIASGVINVGLYLTRTDALNGTNLVATGNSSGLGDHQNVNLTQVASSPAVSKFATNMSWNLQVSGEAGDSFEIYQVGPFTDMDDVNHAIYQNDSIIPYRASALVDEKTHLDRKATILTPKIDPLIEVNESLHLVSSEMGLDQYRTIVGIEFEFDPDSMTMTLTASKYERMTR